MRISWITRTIIRRRNMYDKQKTNSSGSCPLGRCYKTTGAYHYRCSQNAWCKPESIIRICKWKSDVKSWYGNSHCKSDKHIAGKLDEYAAETDTLGSRTASSKECYPISIRTVWRGCCATDVKMAPPYWWSPLFQNSFFWSSCCNYNKIGMDCLTISYKLVFFFVFLLIYRRNAYRYLKSYTILLF